MRILLYWFVMILIAILPFQQAVASDVVVMEIESNHILRDNGEGELSRHAAAQAFLSRFHRGYVLRVNMSDEAAIRGNAVRGSDNRIRAYGGNFSREGQRLSVVVRGANIRRGEVEFYGQRGYSREVWNMNQPLEIPAMTLWRIVF